MSLRLRDEYWFLRVCLFWAGVSLTILLLATQAHCEERRAPVAFKALTVSFVALGATDAAQSLPCLQSAACHERNPLYAGGPGRYVAIKSAGLGGVSVFAWRLRARHPRLAWSLLGGLTAAQGAIVLHNARVLRR